MCLYKYSQLRISMLASGVPWQAALAQFLVTTSTAALFSLFALILSCFGVVWPISLLLLIGSLILLMQNIPLLFNLSRDYWRLVIGQQSLHAVITVGVFAGYYRSAGLIDVRGIEVKDLASALYYSINTWTTLGVSDLTVHASQHLLTSAESLFGVVSIALYTALLWLWCTDNMLPKELALFDGRRRRRNELGSTRIRLRTLRGDERNLKGEWIDPPKPGLSYRYDREKQEWVAHDLEHKLEEGDTFVDAAPKRK
jgi:Ion channel